MKRATPAKKRCKGPTVAGFPMKSAVWIKNGRLFKGWRRVCSSSEPMTFEEAKTVAERYYGADIWRLSIRKPRDKTAKREDCERLQIR